jgi:hypothetical protein
MSLGDICVGDMQEVGTDHRSTPESSSDPVCFDSKDRESEIEIGVGHEGKAGPRYSR